MLAGLTLAGLTTQANAAPPGIPQNLTVTSDSDGSATLSWTAPSGGPTDYDYQYRQHPGGTWTEYDANNTSTARNKTITGLTNNKTYRFRVRAGNNDGDGNWTSYKEVKIWPLAKPTKPEVIPFIVPNAGTFNTYFLVKWTLAGRNPKHGYEINSGAGSADNGYATDATEGQLMRLAPATNLLKKELTYQIKLRGEDGANGPNGPWSDPTSVQGKPATVDHSNVTSNGATLTVSNLPAQWWYKPSGGACSTNAVIGTSTSLTGLSPGTAYTYNIYYRSGCTEDSAKADHWDVKTTFTTQATAPPAPTDKPTVAGGNAQVTLSAASVTNTGGSPITKWQYAYKSKPSDGTYGTYGSWEDVTGTSTTMPNTTVSNLTNGTEYTFKVRAVNSNGNGADSPESDAVTPATTPPAPTDKPTVAGGNAQVTLSAASVANTGGSPITNWQYAYKSKPSDGTYGTYGSWEDVTGTSTTMPNTTVSNLTNGTEYTFKVRAVNSNGNGADSPESDAVTPATTPPAPSKPTVTGGDAQVTLSAASVTNTGGSPITKWQYAYKSKPSGGSYGNYGSWKDVTGTSTTMPNTTVSNLTNGTEYTFKVRAVNSNGDGADSPESDAVTPATTTPAPSKPTVTGGDAQVTLSAASVTNTGGSPITKWQYAYKSKPSGGSYGNYGSWKDVTGTSTTMPNTTVSNLTNGTEYTFKVRAVNSNGNGADSPESDAVTPATTPPAPTKPTVAGGDAQVTLSGVSVTNTGGSPITKWQYAYKSKPSGGTYGTYGSWNNVTGTSTTMPNTTVSNLTNGTEYTFKVRAVNSNGNGADSPESDAVTLAVTATLTTPANASQSVTAGAGDAKLTASNVTHNAATLTIGNHNGDWYYKTTAPTIGICSASAVNTLSVDLADLAGNTSYTFKAYSNSGCTTELAAAAAFLTKPAKPAKPTVTAGAGSGTLTLASSVTGGTGALSKWEYSTDDGTTWTTINVTSTTLSHVVTGLTDGTDYTFKVRAVNATGTGPTSDASDPATPRGKATLTVSSVTHHSATLTIGNHTGDWYYKATTPTSGVCSATAVATASLDLADLAGNTSYTFTAYSNSTCATELATASAFLTKPAKPSKPTVTAGAGRDTLTLSASVTGDGTLTKWQYTTDDGANWSDINVTATTLNHTVTDLTGWTDYTFKVRAVNATGTGPASDASDPATSSAVDSPRLDVDSPRLDDVILPKVVGQVTAATTTAITTRLDAIAAGAAASSRLQDVATASLQFLQSQGQALNRGRLQWEEALSGRSFALPLPLPGLSLADAVADTDNNGASAPGPIVLWGNGDYTGA